MLLVLIGQLTFGSLDDVCTKEQVLHQQAIRLLTSISLQSLSPSVSTVGLNIPIVMSP